MVETVRYGEVNWNYKPRERNREKEIGPEFRFNSTLQVQRIMDSLQHDVGKNYQIEDVQGRSKGFKNDENLAEYVRTGKHDFNPSVDKTQFDSEAELKDALKRDGKIHQTTYVVEPRRIMPHMHKRLMFKGSQ